MAEKVLLVDDEQDFLETLAERMRARGMDVTTASSAKEAIDLTQNQSFDAIILDLMMPDQDGIDTLKELKNVKPDLQIILLTGHATLEKGIEAMKLGALDFVEKPADLRVLTDKIHTAHANRMMLVQKEMEEKLQDILKTKGW